MWSRVMDFLSTCEHQACQGRQRCQVAVRQQGGAHVVWVLVRAGEGMGAHERVTQYAVRSSYAVTSACARPERAAPIVRRGHSGRVWREFFTRRRHDDVTTTTRRRHDDDAHARVVYCCETALYAPGCHGCPCLVAKDTAHRRCHVAGDDAALVRAHDQWAASWVMEVARSCSCTSGGAVAVCRVVARDKCSAWLWCGALLVTLNVNAHNAVFLIGYAAQCLF